MSSPISDLPDTSPPSPTVTFSFGGYATEEVGLPGVTFWPRAGATRDRLCSALLRHAPCGIFVYDSSVRSLGRPHPCVGTC